MLNMDVKQKLILKNPPAATMSKTSGNDSRDAPLRVDIRQAGARIDRQMCSEGRRIDRNAHQTEFGLAYISKK